VPKDVQVPRLSGPTRFRGKRSIGIGMLYRFYNKDRTLLYIGVTGPIMPPIRWIAHQKSSAWWGSTAFVAIEFIPYDGSGSSPIEREAIRREQPLHNVLHNRKRVQIAIRLDEGWDALIGALQYHMHPEDFAGLVAAFKALPDQEDHL
jgi:hypothetical protein